MLMDRDTVIASLKSYKTLLSQHFSIQEMYLFGSYAKGDFNDDSDIDVAVVVDHLEGGYFDYTPKLWKLRRSIDIRIEPILFEQGKDPSGFLETIRLHGIRV